MTLPENQRFFYQIVSFLAGMVQCDQDNLETFQWARWHRNPSKSSDYAFKVIEDYSKLRSRETNICWSS